MSSSSNYRMCHEKHDWNVMNQVCLNEECKQNNVLCALCFQQNHSSHNVVMMSTYFKCRKTKLALSKHGFPDKLQQQMLRQKSMLSEEVDKVQNKIQSVLNGLKMKLQKSYEEELNPFKIDSNRKKQVKKKLKQKKLKKRLRSSSSSSDSSSSSSETQIKNRQKRRKQRMSRSRQKNNTIVIVESSSDNKKQQFKNKVAKKSVSRNITDPLDRQTQKQKNSQKQKMNKQKNEKNRQKKREKIGQESSEMSGNIFLNEKSKNRKQIITKQEPQIPDEYYSTKIMFDPTKYPEQEVKTQFLKYAKKKNISSSIILHKKQTNVKGLHSISYLLYFTYQFCWVSSAELQKQKWQSELSIYWARINNKH